MLDRVSSRDPIWGELRDELDGTSHEAALPSKLQDYWVRPLVVAFRQLEAARRADWTSDEQSTGPVIVVAHLLGGLRRDMLLGLAARDQDVWFAIYQHFLEREFICRALGMRGEEDDRRLSSAMAFTGNGMKRQIAFSPLRTNIELVDL